jgi:hypothetical protein
MNENIMRYDNQKRLIYSFEKEFNITHKYYYKGDFRLICIESPLNRTNFKTSILEKKVNGMYVKLKTTETGDIYHIISKYDKNGWVVFYKRINLIKAAHTFFIEKTIRDKNGVSMIWFENRNGNKSFGFSVNAKILKGFTLKK